MKWTESRVYERVYARAEEKFRDTKELALRRQKANREKANFEGKVTEIEGKTVIVKTSTIAKP